MSSFTKGGTTVTFNYTLFPADLSIVPHQNAGEAENGAVRVYNRNVEVFYIGLLFEDNQANLSNIRSFVRTEAVYKVNTFTFTPDAGHDVGNGVGVAVTVRWWGDNFTEKQDSYQQYKYKMTLRVEVS